VPILLSKKALIQVGGYDDKAYSSDQFDISTRLSKIGKIIYDRKSWGHSERSVAKPTLVVMAEFWWNRTLRWQWYQDSVS
jgi:hypothetical protein